MKNFADNSSILAAITGQISEAALMINASPDALPDDLGALRAIIAAERVERLLLIAERDELSAANEKLHHIITVLRRARFGRKSERLSEEQLNLALEELEIAAAKSEAEDEKKDETLKPKRAKKRRANRGSLPAPDGASL